MVQSRLTASQIVAIKKHKSVTIWGRVFLIIACLLLIIAIVYLISIAIHTDERSEMMKYLYGKYNKEFVVEDVKYAGGLGSDRYLEARAYPKNDESLKFKMWRLGKKGREGYRYKDRYPEALWLKELKPTLEAVVNKHLPDGSLSMVDLTSSDAIKNQITSPMPSYNNAFSTYKKSIYLTVAIKSKSTYIDLENRLFSLINDLRKYNISLAVGCQTSGREYWMENTEIERIRTAQDIRLYKKGE